ncbi:MAG: DUF2117 domain-containing protein [Candidatus Helarchaeota archaeon]
MRLIYALRKQHAIPLLKSSWLVKSIEPDLKAILEECIEEGYPVIISDWSPLLLSSLIQRDSLPFTRQLIGVVIHSPEITELGITTEFLSRLEADKLRYHAILGGVMGRLAILDAHLENKVFINHSYKPSQAIDYLIKRNANLILLLNQANSRKSGIEFGRQVIHNSKLYRDFQIPIIQLDLLHSQDAFFICWHLDHPQFINWIQNYYQLEKINPPNEILHFYRNDNQISRILQAVQIHDKILVNGVVIGEVTANTIEIIAENGKITRIKGGQINSHGLQKLGTVDLEKARITTLKSLRRDSKLASRKFPYRPRKIKIALLTWRAELVYYQANKIDCLISIGDDTTMVSTEILSRFSRPIIGIIDGDADDILYEDSTLTQLSKIAPPHSLFIQVAPGCDDKVGVLIAQRLFKHRKKLKYERLEKLKQSIRTITKEYYVKELEIS